LNTKEYQIILTQSSRRRGEEPKVERSVFIKLCSLITLFLIFIMKIDMKEESGFLITYSPLRPLRFCVKNYGIKVNPTVTDYRSRE